MRLRSSGISDGTSSITINDNDAQTINLSHASLSLTEGNSENITVSLGYQPATNVTVSVSSSHPNSAVSSLSQLVFTPANHTQAQTITITGAEDNNLANENVVLTLSGGGASAALPVSLTDNDTQNIVVSASQLSLDEGGTGTLSVQLAYQPNANVTVNTAASLGLVGVTPSAFVFTSSNYNQAQQLTVNSNHDADIVDSADTLTFSSTGLNSQTTSVSIRDDDAMNFILTPTTLSVDEGQTQTFTVQLSNQPISATSVSVAAINGTAISVSPTSLSFDSSNYNNAQTVTVSGLSDNNAVDELTWYLDNDEDGYGDTSNK